MKKTTKLSPLQVISELLFADVVAHDIVDLKKDIAQTYTALEKYSKNPLLKISCVRKLPER